MSFIGRVRAQTPAAGTRLAAKKPIEITVGITGPVCKKLTPPKQPITGFPALNGDWTATFTVQQSPSGVPKIGQTLTGITFTVKDGQLGGMLAGTISSAGYPDPNGLALTKYDANVTATILGFSCQGTVTFWMYEGRGQAGSTSGITCGNIIGDFRAAQDE